MRNDVIEALRRAKETLDRQPVYTPLIVTESQAKRFGEAGIDLTYCQIVPDEVPA